MPASYLFHPKNAIPIISWFESKSDRELQSLIPMLEKLSGQCDLVAALPSLLDARFHAIE
jgi:RNA polymerase II subunit A small phosphatase-like protein